MAGSLENYRLLGLCAHITRARRSGYALEAYIDASDFNEHLFVGNVWWLANFVTPKIAVNLISGYENPHFPISYAR